MEKEINMTDFASIFLSSDKSIQTLLRILALHVGPVSAETVKNSFNDNRAVHNNMPVGTLETTDILDYLKGQGLLTSNHQGYSMGTCYNVFPAFGHRRPGTC
jgi:hypothetical protein